MSSELSTDNDSENADEFTQNNSRRLSVFLAIEETGSEERYREEPATEASQSLLKLMSLSDSDEGTFNENWSQSAVDHLLLE